MHVDYRSNIANLHRVSSLASLATLALQGIPVPYMLDFIQILECDAQVIFVIEKDATFQQLREDEICWKENQRCIMLTVIRVVFSDNYGIVTQNWA